MKKYIIPMLLVLFLVLSLWCFGELGSFNLPRSAVGLAQIATGAKEVVQIASWPEKVFLVTPDNGYEIFKAYLAEDGYTLLECEQMGAQFQVERDGERSYIYWSSNAYFHKWRWEI